MPLLRKIKRKDFYEIYLLSGEMVTIFNVGQYNYLNTMRPGIWAIGCVSLKGKIVELDPLAPNAVREAFEILGYTIKV